MIDQNGPHYFVAFHTPGPNWIRNKRYNEQPDFQEHVEYISGLHDQGKILVSGPFMEIPGGLKGQFADSGMAIFKAAIACVYDRLLPSLDALFQAFGSSTFAMRP